MRARQGESAEQEKSAQVSHLPTKSKAGRMLRRAQRAGQELPAAHRAGPLPICAQGAHGSHQGKIFKRCIYALREALKKLLLDGEALTLATRSPQLLKKIKP